MASASTPKDFKAKVSFFFDGVSTSLKNRTDLKMFIESLFSKEGKKLLSLNYVFCSDKRLLEINRQYLNHDYYTDIITFDLSEDDSGIIGEVYISLDRVKENATQLKLSIKSELHRVIFHGALHLCGFKDKNKSQALLMREKENLYLAKYFR